MRVYVPATLPTVAGMLRAGEIQAAPVRGYAVTPALREWYSGGDIEELEYVAMMHAARESLRLLAADLRAEPERSLGALPYFSWRVSGLRCFDGATFLRDRLPGAAAIRWEQCQVYGEIQAIVLRDRPRLVELLQRQADLEEAFVAALG